MRIKFIRKRKEKLKLMETDEEKRKTKIKEYKILKNETRKNAEKRTEGKIGNKINSIKFKRIHDTKKRT